MFFDMKLLHPQHKFNFGKAWLVATRGISKFNNEEICQIEIAKLCENLEKFLILRSESSKKRISLRLASYLMSGVIKLWHRQVSILYDETLRCNKKLFSTNISFKVQFDDDALEDGPKANKRRQKKTQQQPVSTDTAPDQLANEENVIAISGEITMREDALAILRVPTDEFPFDTETPVPPKFDNSSSSLSTSDRVIPKEIVEIAQVHAPADIMEVPQPEPQQPQPEFRGEIMAPEISAPQPADLDLILVQQSESSPVQSARPALREIQLEDVGQKYKGRRPNKGVYRFKTQRVVNIDRPMKNEENVEYCPTRDIQIEMPHYAWLEEISDLGSIVRECQSSLRESSVTREEEESGGSLVRDRSSQRDSKILEEMVIEQPEESIYAMEEQEVIQKRAESFGQAFDKEPTITDFMPSRNRLTSISKSPEVVASPSKRRPISDDTGSSPSKYTKLTTLHRYQKIIDIMNEWDFDAHVLTLEDLCEKPINKYQIASLFFDLLALHTMEKVMLKHKQGTLEIGFIEKGVQFNN